MLRGMTDPAVEHQRLDHGALGPSALIETIGSVHLAVVNLTTTDRGGEPPSIG